jgi:hypothetical protein
MSGFLSPKTKKGSLCMRYTSRTPSASKPTRKPKAATIAEAIEAYLLYHEASNSQPKTITWHSHGLGAFRAFCEERSIVGLAAVTTEEAQRWIIYCRKGRLYEGNSRLAR